PGEGLQRRPGRAAGSRPRHPLPRPHLRELLRRSLIASPSTPDPLIPFADAFEGLALLPMLEVALLAAEGADLEDQVNDRPDGDQDDDDQRGKRHRPSLKRGGLECQTWGACPSYPTWSTSPRF